MSPLSYLLFTRFKNQIKGVFRSPAKLIYAVILIALLVLVIVGGGKGAAEMEEFRPASELYAIVLGFYALMLILIVNSGFSTGMSVFKMPDVNFLFAGPFRPLRRSADFDAGLQLLPEPVAVGIVGRGAALYVVPYAEGVFVDAAVVRIRDPPVEFAARCGVQRALQRTDQEVPVMFVHDGIRFLPEDTKKAADPYGTPFFRTQLL